jgi:hypothetical protein
MSEGRYCMAYNNEFSLDVCELRANLFFGGFELITGQTLHPPQTQVGRSQWRGKGEGKSKEQKMKGSREKEKVAFKTIDLAISSAI